MPAHRARSSRRAGLTRARGSPNLASGADLDGTSGPAVGSVLLAARARVPTCVSRCQSRSESPALRRSRKSPGARRVRQRSAPAPTEGAGFLQSAQSAPPAGFAADALARRKAVRTPPDYGWFCSDVGAASVGPPTCSPIAAGTSPRSEVEDRHRPWGTHRQGSLDRSDEHELSRGHVEAECLAAKPPVAVRRRHRTRRWLKMGGSEA